MPPLALYADVDAPFLKSYCSDSMAFSCSLAALCLLWCKSKLHISIMTTFKMFCLQQTKVLQRIVTVVTTAHY